MFLINIFKRRLNFKSFQAGIYFAADYYKWQGRWPSVLQQQLAAKKSKVPSTPTEIALLVQEADEIEMGEL